jgi:hypothetical protein
LKQSNVKPAKGFNRLHRAATAILRRNVNAEIIQLHDSNYRQDDSNYGQAQTGIARSSALKRLPTNLNFESPADALAARRQPRRFPPARISIEIAECEIAGLIPGERNFCCAARARVADLGDLRRAR